MANIESILHETRVFPPSPAFQTQANVSGMAARQALVARAEADYEGFWADLARANLSWKKYEKKLILFYKFPSIQRLNK